MSAPELVTVRIAEGVAAVGYGRRLGEGDTLEVPASLVGPMVRSGVATIPPPEAEKGAA